MIDSHTHVSANWGVRPLLFQIGNIQISSYSLFVLLALFVGFLIVYLLSNKEKNFNENSFYVIIAALVGGVIGAKIPIWIVNAPLIIQEFPNWELILSGRTITGGLIGGTLFVWFIKKKLNIKKRLGNVIAPALAIGIAIGRIGCFMVSCCYGKVTDLPWGVDFGDGLFRHPTQIYETIFCLIVAAYLFHEFFTKKLQDGILFKRFIIIYFIWRFIVEFIRVEPRVLFGLTAYQYVAVVVILYFIIKNNFLIFYKKHGQQK